MPHEPIDRLEYRRLMGHWATGVSLITSFGPRGPGGCTANALTSLSLDPPLLIVCFDRSSRTLEAVQASRRFCINMLSSRQAELSRRFASKESEQQKFEGVEYRLEHETAVLPDCFAYVICEVENELEGGDHVITVGRPIAGATNADVEPLIFVRGQYRTLGRAVDAAPEPQPPEIEVEELVELLSSSAFIGHVRDLRAVSNGP
jgi:3-hydroxy-9,10-secoandrosta-1,3,5(10)-triene-9,17-dione monooxygenase reductase component